MSQMPWNGLFEFLRCIYDVVFMPIVSLTIEYNSSNQIRWWWNQTIYTVITIQQCYVFALDTNWVVFIMVNTVYSSNDLEEVESRGIKMVIACSWYGFSMYVVSALFNSIRRAISGVRSWCKAFCNITLHTPISALPIYLKDNVTIRFACDSAGNTIINTLNTIQYKQYNAIQYPRASLG